jgi:electron transfer flavoprotein beta subunit
MVITGRQAIDGDTAQVGPQIAEQLKIPQVSHAESLRFENGHAIVKRQFEECCHTIKVKLPCLITALSGLAQPRYMTVAGIEKAYDTPIKIITFDDLKQYLNPDWIGIKGSPTNVVASFTKQPKTKGEKLTDLSAQEAAAAIADKLEELYII